ncbi:hypothetical protein CDAR_582211 [Caerostris darwini]|uniref:Citrate transporter-like domain-containing protein n=1 Tax=Caerostris darwini TaxID=1538125 RepID=A0AAV4RKX1_9ARAC|nr:hypothetical protein CDAR_582211 [Caerostris darwini]
MHKHWFEGIGISYNNRNLASQRKTACHLGSCVSISYWFRIDFEFAYRRSDRIARHKDMQIARFWVTKFLRPRENSRKPSFRFFFGMARSIPESRCGYVVLWMAFYFMFEPIPLAVTALLPVAAFPMLGLLTTTEACTPYMKDTIMMYVGSLTLAVAVEHCNLHKRIALKVLLIIGTGARWLMLGFMTTTMFLSMWISNTATTAMMVPIVDAVLDELEKEEKKTLKSDGSAISMVTIRSNTSSQSIWSTEMNKNPFQISVQLSNASNSGPKKDYRHLRDSLLLSIAYAANCGGTGTVIGSGPNLVFKGLVEELYPDSNELTFASWLIYNSPVMVICVFLCWIGLQLFYQPCCFKDDAKTEAAARNAVLKSYKELGSITLANLKSSLANLKSKPGNLKSRLANLKSKPVNLKYRLMNFKTSNTISSGSFLWFLRDPQFIDGWSTYMLNGRGIRDATPAIGVCLLLFIIPSKPSLTEYSPPLLNWRTAQRKIPWGVLLLLGSGFVVADAAKKSHLSVWLSSQLSYLNFLSPAVICIILTFMASILTEVISNMSMATIMLPVVSEMAEAVKVHPFFLMLPVTIGCSFAMILPVGNPSMPSSSMPAP